MSRIIYKGGISSKTTNMNTQIESLKSALITVQGSLNGVEDSGQALDGKAWKSKKQFIADVHIPIVTLLNMWCDEQKEANASYATKGAGLSVDTL